MQVMVRCLATPEYLLFLPKNFPRGYLSRISSVSNLHHACFCKVSDANVYTHVIIHVYQKLYRHALHTV